LLIDTNRKARKWTRAELSGRFLWALVHPAFALSPRLLWGWRRWLLRAFGAKIEAEVHIYPSVRVMIPWNLEVGSHTAVGDRVTLYALGPIRIGRKVTVSQNAHLCAGSHDYTDDTMPLTKNLITIEDEAWICADAFIGPDVVIGRRAIVGARAVVVRDVSENAIVAGNPARLIGSRLSKR
jgi:putative colanic acid biosynthesis acetyltransferase WcaF